MFAVLTFAAPAQVMPHRSRVELDLTPGPAEGSTRPMDVNFDHSARLRVRLFVLEKPTGEVRVQFHWVYDDVNSSGRVERKFEFHEQRARLALAGEHVFTSEPLRLSGKVTKKGILTGMRYIGCATRVLEGGTLLFENYQPATLREEVLKAAGYNVETHVEPRPKSREEEPPPPQKTPIRVAKPALAPVPPPPSPVPAPSPKPVPAAPPAAAGDVVVMGFSFSPAEAKAVLEAVNTLSVEDLERKVRLSKMAAKNLAAVRPIASIEQLPKISYVKTTAIAALKKYVSSPDGKR